MPLAIGGYLCEYESANAIFHTRFVVDEPDAITLAEFESYLENPWKGRTYYRCKLSCDMPVGPADSRVLTLTLGDQAAFLIGDLRGWGKVVHDVRRIEYSGPGHRAGVIHENLPPEIARVVDAEAGDEWLLWVFVTVGEGKWLIMRLTLEPRVQKEALCGDYISARRCLLYSLIGGEAQGRLFLYTGAGMECLTAVTASLEKIIYADLPESRTEHDWASEQEVSGWQGELEPDQQSDEGLSDREHRKGGLGSLVICAGVVIGSILLLALAWVRLRVRRMDKGL